jgi:hypothetical protein
MVDVYPLAGVERMGGASMAEVMPGETVAARIDREAKEERRRAHDSWDRLRAEWLTNRAETMHPDTDWSDRDEGAHGERGDELARLITTTPALLPWMIFSKIEVLEHYLGFDDGTGWSDNREIVMLAAIKTDLLRFKIGDAA